MKECDPTDYITRDEHESICKKSYDSIMNWAHEVANTSEKDRRELHGKVEELKDFIPKFQWWFIGLLIAIIISSYVMPKLTQNGTHKTLADLNTKVNIIVDKQAAFDTILNDVREDQKRRQAKEK